MHRAEVVRIQGESYRKKEAEERQANRTRQRAVSARSKPAAMPKLAAPKKADKR